MTHRTSSPRKRGFREILVLFSNKGIPACAGMTHVERKKNDYEIPACAGMTLEWRREKCYAAFDRTSSGFR